MAAIGNERTTAAGGGVADQRRGIHPELGDGALGLGRAVVDRGQQAGCEIFLLRLEPGQNLSFGRQVRVDHRAGAERSGLERCFRGHRGGAFGADLGRYCCGLDAEMDLRPFLELLLPVLKIGRLLGDIVAIFGDPR